MVLITGVAGFIGYHLAEALLERGESVVGLDNLNSYYDPRLKMARLRRLVGRQGFSFREGDVADKEFVESVFATIKGGTIYHLAAQAGVRYSLENPGEYVSSNLVGFMNILEACRRFGTEHLVYASSSSVYGLNHTPFSTRDNVDHPVSLYAATKKANEGMAHSYSHLFDIPTTGLRFFTVYGPWGRPDMAAWLFADAIMDGRPVKLFNHGQMERDFTYIDDIVAGVLAVGAAPPRKVPSWTPDCGDPSRSSAPWRVYNIGNNRPCRLLDFLSALEGPLGRKADIQLAPMQPGDVQRTSANIDDIRQSLGFEPRTDIGTGLARFAEWFLKWKSGEYS